MSRLSRSKKSNMVFYALLGLLVLGLGGFGVQSFNGSIRSIGSVGNREISINSYASALRRTMAAFGQKVGAPINFQQAQALGLDRTTRTEIVTQAALDNETARLGISVGDDRVRAALLAIPAFRGVDDNFDREAYAFSLKQNGLTEKEFEGQVRDESARGLLQTAIISGVGAPPAYVNVIFAYIAEKRGFSWATLDPTALVPPVAAPDEAAMTEYYTANPAAFTRPEAKTITYLKLFPEMLVDQVTVSDEDIQAAYDARLSDYKQPERRLVERLVFGTDAEAAAAKVRLDAGEVTFDALVVERNLTLSDIDLGDMAKPDLGAAGDAVFALTEPGIVGPFASDLGPALYRMNGILAAQETPLASVRDELRTELALDAARRKISESANDISDRLASGATLEQLAAETAMTLGTLDFYDGADDPMLAYPEFTAAAAAVKPDDYPEAVNLSDGGIIALRMDGTKAAELRPLADVRDAVAAGWTADETQKRLTARATEIKAALAGGADAAALGLTLHQVEPARRDAPVDGAPASLVATAFQMAEGETRLIDEPGKVTLVTLSRILPADIIAPADGSDDAKLRTNIAAQIARSLAGDLFDLYATAEQTEAGIYLDETAIRAVEAQMQ